MSDLFIVPEGHRRARADKALAMAFPEHSRVAWQRAIDAGLVKRNGVALMRKDEVQAGDELTYAMPEVVPTDLTPAQIPLEILFEDEHLLVVNKPAGMVVHPGAGTTGDTLVHALLAHCAGTLSGIGGVERPGIVHRLDRETTGVIVVAKTDTTHRGLAAQFSERDLHKEYLALAMGVPQLLSGSIDKAIQRDSRHRHRMTTSETGKHARTDWKVEETYPDFKITLFRCHIHTGRTHQIRVHLKSIGHSILGDHTYGWRPLEYPDLDVPRVMLHAAYLKFEHPITKEEMEITAPLPADFKVVVAALKT
ncbi:RluA family pseudouridine synthase [Synoicihabitans lomoniglobus]|uniref:Pseudouridine synthase n=1 Tax=Synoicihabitans lomoniglobus TaxID=2909285 RepID=A0AAF0CS71_9BACT|nr:RluA family pseudouridine synthase [Opitutaceae bacterium LMO-M01]WED67039.1 RluA family pseudouridine synthase [Opitutaceae bacterium LMO-M01]